MKKALVFILFCPLFFAYAFAQEIPVKLKAEKLKSSEETGIIFAQGSVEVELRETKVIADSLRLDPKTKLVTAEGRVRLLTKEYQAESNYLTYDAQQEFATFTGFRSALSPKNIQGKLYVSSQSLVDLKEKMKGKEGNLTTCDLIFPHYLLRAGNVNYIPEDRLEAWPVTLYVGEMPVFWLPYLRYDLKRQWKKNWVFGHNEVEGDYLKTAWDYPAGLLLLDYMEKKGKATGIDTNYHLGFGLGSLYLYFLDEKDTGIHDRVVKIEHQQKITPWTNLKLNHRYANIYLVPSGRMDQTFLGTKLEYTDVGSWNLNLDSLDDRAAAYQRYALQFNRSFAKSNFNYSFSYDFAKSNPRWLRKSQRFNFFIPLLAGRVNFNTRANYYHSLAYEGDLGEERVEPLIELTGREPAFFWRYSENWFIDFRQHLSPGSPRYDFLEKHPEFEMDFNALDLGWFSLQPTFGGGYWREVKYVPQLNQRRDFAAFRYRSSLNASRDIPLGLGTKLNLRAGWDQFAYSPGDQMYALREQASLNTELFSFFKNDLNFRQGYTEGNSPFLFDQLSTRYHDLTEKMTFYYLDKFSWSIEGGHNWLTNRYYDVMTNLRIVPDKKFNWTASTGWDLENRRYKDLVTSLQLAPYSFFAASLSLTQDLNGEGLKLGSAFYDCYFLEGAPNQWHLQVSQVFDPQSKEFKVRDIMVSHDLHCWEMKYRYNDYRKEFSFIFTLKAIPEEPVGYAPGKGFYFEGFEREIKEFKRQGEVRRY